MLALIRLTALSQIATFSILTLPGTAVFKTDIVQARQLPIESNVILNPLPLAHNFISQPPLQQKLPSTGLGIQPQNTLQLLQQGFKLYQKERFSEAVKVLQQAIQAAQTQGDRLNQALALNYLSLAYQQLGQWSEATKAIASSLNLLGYVQQGGRGAGGQGGRGEIPIQNLEVFAQALNTQGRLQLTLGQSENALNSWQKATTAYSQMSDTAGAIGSQINQAQALQALGLYRRALITLTQVNQTLQQQPDSLLKATGLLSLGNALRVVGDLDQKPKVTEIHSLGSRQVLEQGLAVAKRIQSPKAVAEIQLSLGNTAQAQQDTKAALAFYQQAATSSTSPMTQLQSQLNQLHLLLETRQWANAQILLPQIQAQLATLPLSRKTIYARINFAQSLTRLRQRTSIEDMAIEHKKIQPLLLSQPLDSPSWQEIAQLVATTVQQAKSLEDSRAQAYALGTLGGLYEQTRQWAAAEDLTQQALLLAQAINAPDITYRWQWQLGRLHKAQKNMQGAIAAYTEAVSALQSLRSDLVAINPDIQFSFRESVEPVYRELVGLLLQSKGNQPSQENLKQARNVIESLQLAELDNFFRVACLEAKPVLIDSVIDKDDPTAAVIYPIILPEQLGVILKLPQQPLRYYTTPVKQKQIENILERLSQALAQRNSQETLTLSQRVYEWLIKQAEADIASSKVKTLVFVLDGSLRNIPMAALYDGQRYLVEKYGVALTPGLQLLNPQPLEREQLKALAAGLSEARSGFPSLSFVPRELEQVQSRVPGVALLNQQFTSTAFQSKINSLPFPVVHLATHGQFSSQADKTFILTWDDRINVNQLNDLLRTTDPNKRGIIELLVLSACETVTGDKRAALGLAGVSVRAGARSTLATLWRVNDEASAFLMGQFYQELANNAVTKAEALQRAQLALLKDSRFKRPHFWAPYVLVGNWL